MLALILCGCLVLAACGTGSNSGAPANPTDDVVVLFTNDVHCAVDGDIGYSGLAAYKKELEKTSKVLLVDVGDAIQGQAIGTLSNGESLIKLMNSVGYDVAIPGNHEFDYGMSRFLELSKKAEFPYISANFTDLTTKKTVFDPYKIIECGGLKIAFVGATTPKTITSSTPVYFQDANGNYIYGFEQGNDGKSFYSCIQKSVDSARAAGADYVILLSHLGITADASPYTSPELIANTSGIDVVLDGHSHSEIVSSSVKNAKGNWTLLTSTGTQLKNIGVLEISKSGNISTRLVSEVTAKDAEVEAQVQALQGELAQKLGEVIGNTDYPLVISDPVTGQRIVRNTETNLGDLCADAYRSVTGADIAFVNGGGVRSNIAAGPITYGALIKVQPYNNAVCMVEATGQEILDALELGVRAWPEESGGFLQVSGMTYEIDLSIPSSVKLDDNGMFVSVGGAYRVRNVMIGGKPLDPAAKYTVAGHDYMLKNGGDGCNMFMDNTLLKDSIMLDNQALITYITGLPNGTVGSEYADPYGAGRIIQINR